ncbi:hypothetical protein [Candidatus Manganitrophus noduliformans]|uniref:Uncharacterized protein n=1 Tax=Candidatus Manganitrophus noduliformans TaxID=2606439 RepID=A0A7X6IA95_9BACT|nr:hypothetical protein [Candidatus Manganitrophus noduliformans]NKE70180.1 hypothetical protein [Candidatus Manganitrophus noduliformans]
MLEQLIVGLDHQKSRTVLLFDPGNPKSVRVDPLFLADSETLDWIASFFYRSQPTSLSDDQGLFRDLLDIAVGGPVQEATLPGVYALAGLGPEELKRLFSLRGRPEHIRFLTRFNRLSFSAQKEGLDRICRSLSFLGDSQIAAAFSRAELYLPILFSEPILLAIAVSPAYSDVNRILPFLFQWTLHQILIRRSKPDDLPLFIDLGGLAPPEGRLLNALGEKCVGLLSLSDQGESACPIPPQGVFLNEFAFLSFKKKPKPWRFPFFKFLRRG